MSNSIKDLFNKSLHYVLSHWKYFNYSRRTASAGIDKRYIVLSFDCDREEDASAALKIARWMKKNKIKGVFAVPGIRLEKSSTDYKNISKMGFEFLNHGYSEHTISGNPATWYHLMNSQLIKEDIVKGHNTLKNVLGIEPLGFRAPHFGLFKQTEQLEIIYSTVIELGYKYTSTTTPAMALTNGAVYKSKYELWEFPLTGTFDNPETILDSWSFIASPDRIFTPNDYISQFNKMVNFFSNYHLPCILNFYVDPTQVVNFTGYFEAVELALKKGYISKTYSELLNFLI